MVLLTTIQKKLKGVISESQLRYEFDVRYLSKWINKYPNMFPKFVRENKYEIIFNPELYRYEFHKI